MIPTYSAGYAITFVVICLQQDPYGELSLGSWLLGSIPGLAMTLGNAVPADGIVWTLVVEIVFYALVVSGASLIRRTKLFPGVLFVFSIAFHLLLNSDPGFLNLLNLRDVILLSVIFLPIFAFGMTLSQSQSQSYNETTINVRQIIELCLALITFVGLSLNSKVLSWDAE